jgi:hypothetical protein
MAASAAKQSAVAMVCGDDEFSVKQRAKSLYSSWAAELGGSDHEIIDAAVGNSGEPESSCRLREALQTLLFSAPANVWFQNRNLKNGLPSQSVTEILACWFRS